MAALLTGNPASVDEIRELNLAILNWIPKVRSKLKTSVLQFQDGKTKSFIIRKRKIGNQKEFKLILSLDSKTHREFDAIDGVGFLFERHGVFVHKGVGRGYRADGSVSVKHPSGNPRIPREWFNPIMQQKVPELADWLAEISADAVVNAARLRIV